MAFVIAVSVTDLPRNQIQLSYQFVLLPTKTSVPPRDLYSHDLWIAICYDREAYLWCKLRVTAIEEVWDSSYLQCYLISGDLERSEYFMRPSEKPGALRLDSLTWFNAEVLQTLKEIGREQEEALERLARDFVPIRMVRPSSALVDALWHPASKKFTIDWFGSIVRRLKLKYTVGELYRYHASPSNWSPYESFALSYLEQKFPKEAVALLLPGNLGMGSREYVRTVDTVMREIDPDRVKVRRFVNPPETEIDDSGLEAYLKTERADMAHQAILGDLAKRIVSLGQRPLESNSIDIFVESTKRNVLIEVKSASKLTFYRQCMKGAMQLLEYGYCLKVQQNVDCQQVLVVQSIENAELMEYLSGLLGQVGIVLLKYDGTLDWPNRTLGFDGLIGSM